MPEVQHMNPDEYFIPAPDGAVIYEALKAGKVFYGPTIRMRVVDGKLKFELAKGRFK